MPYNAQNIHKLTSSKYFFSVMKGHKHSNAVFTKTYWLDASPSNNNNNNNNNNNRIVTRNLRKNLEAVPRKHSVDSLQKTAILGTSHIIRKVLQCEAWILSGGDHCWFKRSSRKKRHVTRDINNNNNNNKNHDLTELQKKNTHWVQHANFRKCWCKITKRISRAK